MEKSMRITKQPSIVITFPTTTAAMAFEHEAQAGGLQGRLIPVPREISAGCGLAFMTRSKEALALDQFLEQRAVEYQGRYELDL